MQDMVCVSLGYDQFHYDPGEAVVCPACGHKLTILKNRIGLLYLIPTDVAEEALEGKETNEEDFGYIAAVCEECGFNITTDEKFIELELGERFTSFINQGERT